MSQQYCYLLLPCLLVLLAGCGKQENGSTSAQTAPAMEFAPTSLSASDPRIAVMGRTQTLENGNLRFGYPGVSLKFNIAGTSAQLFATSSTAQSYLEVMIDDKEPRVVKLTTTRQAIPLFDSERQGARTIEIIHRSETWHGVVTIHGLEVIDGDLIAPPTLPEKHLLILGDSVTCGEAIERTAECKKDTSWWNPRLSYGMLTAKALEAQVHLVCFGGRGLVRSWNGKTDELNLPDYFELAIADAQTPVGWDHSRYTPDLILSAIGTNDFSEGIPERDNYVDTYVRLIQRLFELHPNTQIVLTEGAILNGDKKTALNEYLAEVARRINNPHLTITSSNHYPGDDCDAHPTKDQHAAMARDLTKHIMRTLNLR